MASLLPELQKLAQYLLGEFDNRSQAIDEPIWYVNLRLWHRLTPLFSEDSMTIFAEQANALQLDSPYRQRLLRIQVSACEAPNGTHGEPSPEQYYPLQVQYYGFKDPSQFKEAGQDPAKLQSITEADIEQLPGCLLEVTPQRRTNAVGVDQLGYAAIAPEGSCCQFSYPERGERKIGQVALGFWVSESWFYSYDKGISPETGEPIWGALMGPYQFQKRA
ncbi:chromophore lyase CpcT/CpeT [Alkalinema sp. FACHB-956]|uniref:chromophore lyase CpcT/CpeT n=1 Tax=Alkalinema sp. FACHB-956 TaxID=2692768 RepID=UPI00168A18E7|nr:chromophore lyase CpcT/CpeT [Alkalinema sp. FACHB-956]MBD2325329.1 chromophore lyase CpcT/CpeT [Alkalinema sp. FACHB-956]